MNKILLFSLIPIIGIMSAVFSWSIFAFLYLVFVIFAFVGILQMKSKIADVMIISYCLLVCGFGIFLIRDVEQVGNVKKISVNSAVIQLENSCYIFYLYDSDGLFYSREFKYDPSDLTNIEYYYTVHVEKNHWNYNELVVLNYYDDGNKQGLVEEL